MSRKESTDVMTPEQRSQCMSRIKGKDTKPEIRLRKTLWANGLRYRVHYRLAGKPDIAFPGKRVAVFVDGCFWHGCPIHATSPKTNAEFWEEKIQGNIERDRRVTEDLTESGWTVLRFWEHEIKSGLDSVVTRIQDAIKAK